MKKLFRIDCVLYPLGLLTVLSGFALHIAGHGNSHRIWEMCAVSHILVAMLFAVFIVRHLLAHPVWLKNFRLNVSRPKGRVTALLALLAVFTTLTGLSLLAVYGVNTGPGLLHYKIGIAFTLFLIWHGVSRFHILRKGIFVRRKV